MFNRSFLIEEKCRFLSNFSLQTAEVELPGEFLLPKVTIQLLNGLTHLHHILLWLHFVTTYNRWFSICLFIFFLIMQPNHYYVRIARFMPRVEIVQKHNTAARRLYIRGHNGKIYPYLVVNDACLTESRREERVLQLLRMLNHFLGKQKVNKLCIFCYI